RAEFLQGHLAQVHAAEQIAQRREIRRLLHPNFHQNAASEVDAVIQPGIEEQDNGSDREESRNRQAGEAALHELDIGVVGNQTKAKHDRAPHTTSFLGRADFIQSTINCRTTRIAVNIDVTMPTEIATANPRTGPEPKANRIAMAMSVVRFESRIVENARVRPASRDATPALPSLYSSRLRSLISTCASTAMPMVRRMPAMPGNDSVACMLDRMPRMSTRLRETAITAKMPNSP